MEENATRKGLTEQVATVRDAVREAEVEAGHGTQGDHSAGAANVVGIIPYLSSGCKRSIHLLRSGPVCLSGTVY